MRTRAFLLAVGIAIPFVLFAACGRSPVSPEPPPACTYTLSPTSLAFDAPGGSSTFAIATAATCAWAVSVEADWLAASPLSGSGNATITVTAAGNPQSSERTGRVTAAGTAVAIRQAGREPEPCTYALTPDTQTFSAAGGTGAVAVQTGPTCTWSATSDDSWLALGPSQGTGPGSIPFTVAVNDAFTGRVSRIRLNDRAATIRQDGRPATECSYSVDPTTARVHWHGPGVNIQLTTSGGCSWTARAPDWIDLGTSTAGTGTATIQAAIGIYTAEAPRTGAVEIRWPTATAGQNVWVTQEGCAFAIAPSTMSVAAAGGRRSAMILAGAASVDCMLGCPWEAHSEAAWIHIVGSGTGTGDGAVYFDIDVNATGLDRSGVIRMSGGHMLVVAQER